MIWIIIGVTIWYFVSHETHRQRNNLENRLRNVNSTVLTAYENGMDLPQIVDFIRLFTDNTTLDPLRITVYDNKGGMIADNPAETIHLYDEKGNRNPEIAQLFDESGQTLIKDMVYYNDYSMVSAMMSKDSVIYSLAALPFKGEVADFLSIDPMIWFVVILLGLISSAMAFFGVRAVCSNVYSLRDFAKSIANDNVPEDLDEWHFSKDELGDVSRNLLTLYRDKLHVQKEKMDHERQISMNIGHELKTPIGIIKGYIDTVITDPDMPEDIKYNFLVRAKQNTDRLTNLVNDLTMVMRLQDSGEIIQMTPINFTNMASRLSEDVEQGKIAGDMSFKYVLPENCKVYGHERLLNNALLNLIYNSAKHSEGTEMTLKWIKNEDGFHIFTFSDNGIGVGEEHLGKLFDLFYRVEYGRSRKKGGSGLGLPLVLRIINAMGGKIWVENGEDRGLKFTFTLRAAE